MPFKKGVSGNPAGTAKGAHARRQKAAELLKHLLPRAAKVYEEMLEEDENKGFAAKEVFDRCLGKAPQAVDLTDGEGGPITLVIKDS